jgi:hypothetical protein
LFLKRLLAPALYLWELLGSAAPYIVSPVLDFHSDRVFSKASKSINPVTKPRSTTLLITGYYFGKSHILIDGLIYLALRQAGHNVLPVIAGRFFADECPYFGGNYRKYRPLRIRTVEYIELKFWRKIMRVEPLRISDYVSDSKTHMPPMPDVDNMKFEELRGLNILGFDVLKAAKLVHANLMDAPRTDETEYSKRALQAHCANIVRYIYSFENLLLKVRPDSLVCNSPFYYKWSVPAHLAKNREISVFSYMISEKPNSFFFTRKTDHLLEVEDLEGSVDYFTEMYKLNNAGSEAKLKDDWLEFLMSPQRSHYADTYGLLSSAEKGDASFSEEAGLVSPRVLIPLNHPSDAAVLQGSPIFGDYIDFLSGMVKLASQFPNVRFVFKVHPAEKLHDKLPGFRSSISYLYEAGFEEASNCELIQARSEIPVNEIIRESRLIICYTSSVGIAASILGLTTIQCSFSATRSPRILACPGSFDDLLDIIKMELAGSYVTQEQSKIRASNALAYALMHYVHSQIDTGLFVTDDITRRGYIRKDVNEFHILSNTYLQYIATTISEGNDFASKKGIPPSSGPVEIINGRLVPRSN